MFFSSCRIGRINIADGNDSLVLQNNINTTEYTTLDVSDRLAIRRREEEQRIDDKYTNSIFERKPPLRSKRDNSVKEHRTIRVKPKRVTVISLPPSTSQSTLDDPYTISNYHLMTQTADYEQNINNVPVRHVRWPY